jgi:hypothetical protein
MAENEVATPPTVTVRRSNPAEKARRTAEEKIDAKILKAASERKQS